MQTSQHNTTHIHTTTFDVANVMIERLMFNDLNQFKKYDKNNYAKDYLLS